MKCPNCGAESGGVVCAACGASSAPAEAMVQPIPVPGPSRKSRVLGGFGLLVVVLALILAAFFLIRQRGAEKERAKEEIGEEITIPGRAAGGLADEIAADAVLGKVSDIQRSALTVKSLATGKVYTFRLGRATRYSNRRPAIGEKVRIRFIVRRKRLVAKEVDLQ